MTDNILHRRAIIQKSLCYQHQSRSQYRHCQCSRNQVRSNLTFLHVYIPRGNFQYNIQYNTTMFVHYDFYRNYSSMYSYVVYAVRTKMPIKFNISVLSNNLQRILFHSVYTLFAFTYKWLNTLYRLQLLTLMFVS